MKITLTLDEEVPQIWDLAERQNRLMATEAAVIEKVTGLNYRSQILPGVKAGSATAIRAVLWVLTKRRHPTLQFADFDYPADAVEVSLGRGELTELLEQARLMPMSDEERAVMDAYIASEIAKADEDPKAPLSPDGENTALN